MPAPQAECHVRIGLWVSRAHPRATRMMRRHEHHRPAGLRARGPHRRPAGPGSVGGDLGAQPPRLPPRLGARRHPGIWAFHRHILPHVEGPDGMSGMVTALVVTPEPIDVGALLKA